MYTEMYIYRVTHIVYIYIYISLPRPMAPMSRRRSEATLRAWLRAKVGNIATGHGFFGENSENGHQNFEDFNFTMFFQ